MRLRVCFCVKKWLRDPREVALREFKRLNEAHHPQPLPREALAELDRILAAAEREAEKGA